MFPTCQFITRATRVPKPPATPVASPTLLLLVVLLLHSCVADLDCRRCHRVHPSSIKGCHDLCVTYEPAQYHVFNRCLLETSEKYTFKDCHESLIGLDLEPEPGYTPAFVKDNWEPVQEKFSFLSSWFSDTMTTTFTNPTALTCNRGQWVRMLGPAKNTEKYAVTVSAVPRFNSAADYSDHLGAVQPLEKSKCYFTFWPPFQDITFSSPINPCYYPLEVGMCVAISGSCVIHGYGGWSHRSRVTTARHVNNLESISYFLCSSANHTYVTIPAPVTGVMKGDAVEVDPGLLGGQCWLGYYDTTGVYSEFKVSVSPHKLSTGFSLITSSVTLPHGKGSSGSPCFSEPVSTRSKSKVFGVYSGYLMGVGHLMSIA